MDPLAFLRGLEVLGMKFGLESIQAICAAMDHPEARFHSVIVAGTNGKGSVTAMLSAALHAAGYRAARYTSPHLERLQERFAIGEAEVTTDELRAAVAGVQDVVEDLLQRGVLAAPPTFFECATAAAFELFRRAGVDIAVLEVGLGGRLDATNVVTPLVAAITSIDLDHQAQLGSTVAEIAWEKAGVVKTGVPLVCGVVPPEADVVIARVCRERAAPLVRVGTEVRVTARLDGGATIATVESPQRRLADVRLALPGAHQALNAATAVGVLDALCRRGVAVDDAAVAAGLTRAKWPGRLERFQAGGCEVVLDAAHNPAGARALADYLRAVAWTEVSLVFGAMTDKDAAGMLAPLLPLCRAVVTTTAASPRARPAVDLARLATEMSGGMLAIEAVADPAAALRRACERSRRVVAAGSIFLIGPLRGILR